MSALPLLAPSVGTDLTGLIWMPIAAVIIPVVLLVVIWVLGSRNAV